MPALVRKLNHRNIELYPDTADETVGVVRRDGSIAYIRWLGFVSKSEATQIADATPVRLEVSRYSNDVGLVSAWHDLEAGQFVQGCLTEDGVYAVTVETIRNLTIP